MYTDMYGAKRAKIGLHIHTSNSDGKLSPEDVLSRYHAAGYDAVALTDHWYYGESGTYKGMTVLSGCEYNAGSLRMEDHVVHIVGFGMTEKHSENIDRHVHAQTILDEIHRCGGMAVLAHPAWSLNSPEFIRSLHDVDATEIYNTVSGMGESFRPDSSLLLDMLALGGVTFPTVAADDSHFYTGDECVSYIMAECDPTDPEDIKRAIRERRFYATQGPEIHLSREGNVYRVDCSPCARIVFVSNYAWAKRVTEGEGLTHAEYTLRPDEYMLRAYVEDGAGHTAWSNYVN